MIPILIAELEGKFPGKYVSITVEFHKFASNPGIEMDYWVGIPDEKITKKFNSYDDLKAFIYGLCSQEKINEPAIRN